MSCTWTGGILIPNQSDCKDNPADHEDAKDRNDKCIAGACKHKNMVEGLNQAADHAHKKGFFFSAHQKYFSDHEYHSAYFY